MRLGLVIDLDVCVGCHACAVACKEWNASGSIGPLADYQPYGADPTVVWFNRIRHF
jgi:Fe-S-cluster-containing dehydrogenase component